MADEKPPEGWHRIFEDSAEGVTVAEPDSVAHSPEAMKILMEKGVEAYQAYVAEHSA